MEEQQDDAVIGRALRWSLVVIAGMAAVGVAAAFVLTRPEPERETTEAAFLAPKPREQPDAEPPNVSFVPPMCHSLPDVPLVPSMCRSFPQRVVCSPNLSFVPENKQHIGENKQHVYV